MAAVLPFRRCSVTPVGLPQDSPSAPSEFRELGPDGRGSISVRPDESLPELAYVGRRSLTAWSRALHRSARRRSGIKAEENAHAFKTPDFLGHPASLEAVCGAPLAEDNPRRAARRSALSNTRSIGWTRSLPLSPRRPRTKATADLLAKPRVTSRSSEDRLYRRALIQIQFRRSLSIHLLGCRARKARGQDPLTSSGRDLDEE